MAANWYFDIRESEYGWIKPENTVNVDEGGIMAGFGLHSLVIGSSDPRRKAFLKGSQSRTWTSSIEAVTADGRLLKPGIIFKGKELQKQWFIDEFNKIADWYYITSDNGWTDNHIAVEWLKEVYLPQTQPSDDLTDSAPVDKVNFIKAYAKAREVGMTKKNILSGWRVTGNWPISRHKALIHAEIQPDKKETTPGSDGHRDGQVDSDNTPKTSRHIRDLGKNKGPSTRRRYSVISKGFEAQESKIASLSTRIASLEEEVGRLSRGKKRKAIPNLNKKFITLAEALAAGDTISEPNEAIEGADVVEDVIEVGGIEEDKRSNSGKEELVVPQAAAMASSTTNPPAAPDPFDLGIHTPANLNRGARAALLQNSPAAVNGTIGVSPGPRRMAQTPSSPLNAATIAAAATEGAKRASPSSTFEQQPVSIIESANDLARERIEEYNAKLMVFQAFCAKFEEAAQQFTTGPQRRFAQQFADSFLDSWKRELTSAGPTIPKPTYSSVAAASPRTDRDRLTHRQQQQHGRRQTDPPHRQGQPRTIAPPRQDLRVFIRLEAGAPARAHSSYAIRTLIQEKLSAVSNKIRQVFQVRSGWAVLTADSETRDFLVEKQAEWAAELGATAVETNKEWFTYVVSDFPTRLTDFHGKEVDSDSIVRDEIEIQTGLKPIDIRPARQFSDNPLTKTLLVSFLKPTKRFWSLFGSSAARLIDKIDRPRQSSLPTFISAQLDQRECTACSADSPKSNEDMPGPLALRHTDNDTWHNNQSRIWKPNKATSSHHTNSRAFVVQVQRHQEHPRASWWPQALRRATKRRRSPSIPDQAHRENGA
ncbi:hypothetical protein FocnCong_v013410 [Fusarium oxysporum f. sp. conglutinans]|nr:hypothetical protein FocnCong_v013410 [Fusarium oxysporum f. sp. conglutinans]